MKMKSILALCVVTGVLSPAAAQQVFTGLDFEFVKAPFTNPAEAANQDRMTDIVWITRGKAQGIFNIAQEPSFTGNGASSPSPIGTEWAVGSAADWQTLTFGTWGDVHGGNPPGLVGQDLVVHLVDDDIYIDLRFTSWGGPATGGAFSYLRSTITASCNAADIAEPFGVLDLADLGAFVSAFVAGDPAADIAEPFGVLDLADLGAFVGAFLEGCP